MCGNQVGVIEDTENRNRLAKLLRFYSSKSDDSMTSLEEYASRMKEGQKGIYYMVSTSGPDAVHHQLLLEWLQSFSVSHLDSASITLQLTRKDLHNALAVRSESQARGQASKEESTNKCSTALSNTKQETVGSRCSDQSQQAFGRYANLCS